MPPTVFTSRDGQVYEHGIAAAGEVQYQRATVALTGSLVSRFAFNTLPDGRYEYDALLFLDLSVGGIVTTRASISGGTPDMQMMQQAQISATVVEVKANAGTSTVTIASSSLNSGFRSVVVRGSAYKASAAGVLSLDVSIGGTGSLFTGSTMRVWRAEA